MTKLFTFYNDYLQGLKLLAVTNLFIRTNHECSSVLLGYFRLKVPLRLLWMVFVLSPRGSPHSLKTRRRTEGLKCFNFFSRHQLIDNGVASMGVGRKSLSQGPADQPPYHWANAPTRILRLRMSVTFSYSLFVIPLYHHYLSTSS